MGVENSIQSQLSGDWTYKDSTSFIRFSSDQTAHVFLRDKFPSVILPHETCIKEVSIKGLWELKGFCLFGQHLDLLFDEIGLLSILFQFYDLGDDVPTCLGSTRHRNRVEVTMFYSLCCDYYPSDS